MTKFSSEFIGNQNDPSGIAVFKFKNKRGTTTDIIEISLSDITSYFNFMEMLNTYKKMIELDVLEAVKSEIDILKKSIDNLDY